eukprot:gene9969-2145_t
MVEKKVAKTTTKKQQQSQSLHPPVPLQQQLGATSSTSMQSRSQLNTKSGSKLHSQSRHRLSKQANNEDEWLQAKDPVKPPNQLSLTEAELNEEFTRILRADNPNAPHNIVRFSYKDGTYKQMASVEQCAFHFVLNGSVLHKDSDEAQRQLARHKYKRGSALPEDSSQETSQVKDQGDEESSVDKLETDASGNDKQASTAEEKNEDSKEGEEEDDDGDAPNTDADKPLRNQFNFSERAAQCFAPAHRDRETMTEAPSRATFNGNVTQWTIFDAYVTDQVRQKASKTSRRESSGQEQKSGHQFSSTLSRNLGDDSGGDWDEAARLISLSIAKKMERLVNLNTYHDVAQDFKYWDDPSDQFKEKQGSLLPLWRFTNEYTKRKHVTCLVWCPTYPDLLFAGFGSYDYTKQSSGAICAYSLKNPSHPEYIIPISSGVMCLDIHPKQSSLVVVGLYDGSVAVFDMSRKANRESALVRSTAKTGKHTDPVWGIKWHSDDVDQNRNFSSVSSDGRVSTWTMVQTELQHTDIIRLSYDTSKRPLTADGTATEPLFGLGSGTCISFNQHRDNIFLIGTGEGQIHQCCRAYTSKFLKIFQAHGMAVYTVEWNPFHPRVFISCSADWTVKVWDELDSEPVFTFDLGNSVGDVAWSPYSSTVFAAVTTDGKVHVFDLQQNKYASLCEQKITKKAGPTHVVFNFKSPIIAVGDDRGATSTFKLSPNLRKALMEKKKKTPEEQVAALDRLLESVKETPHVPGNSTQAPS